MRYIGWPRKRSLLNLLWCFLVVPGLILLVLDWSTFGVIKDEAVVDDMIEWHNNL